MAADLDIPPRFYGPLIETTVRVVTWNVWGRYSHWQEREEAITAALAEARPDVVVLTESWERGEESQSARLADPLGLPHHAFTGVTAQEDEAALSGVAVLSRWPITKHPSHTFGALRVQQTEIAGPRGPLHVCGAVMDAWWPDQSLQRQGAVRGLLDHLATIWDDSIPLVVCGDFNADPDSDEIRVITGRAAAPVPGLSFYDAWDVAGGTGGGCTWSNSNAWAQQLLWPDRRIDYIFTGMPRRGGAGHPRAAELLGTRPLQGIYASDHFALQADLRY